MVIWIIGLSGSGKTYTSVLLNNIFKKKNKTIIVDGDEFRKYISYDLKYTLKDRKKNSQRIQNFSKYLESKGFLVIVPILSIFREHQIKNRKLFDDYYQIFINTDLNKLKQRNNKNIYSKTKNVVGKDIKFMKPLRSDYIFKNNFDKGLNNEIKEIVNIINEKIKFNNKKTSSK